MILSLALGLGMYVLTLGVQMAPVSILIHIATSRHLGSLLRPSYRANLILLQLVAALLLLVHLVNIGLWALLLCLCGEFAGFEAAYYHSAMNYSSLGYGDIVMSTRWRLLGPLETINGWTLACMVCMTYCAGRSVVIQRTSAFGSSRGISPSTIGRSVSQSQIPRPLVMRSLLRVNGWNGIPPTRGKRQRRDVMAMLARLPLNQEADAQALLESAQSMLESGTTAVMLTLGPTVTLVLPVVGPLLRTWLLTARLMPE